MSASYNGSDDYHNRAESFGSNSWTMASWALADVNSQRRTICSVDESVSNRWLGNFDTSSTWEVHRGATQYDDGGSAISTATWYFVAATYTGETTPGSSADGVLDLYRRTNGTGSSWGTTNQVTGLSDYTALDNIHIGGFYGATSGWYHDGLIANVKYWTTALSSAALLAEYPYRHAQTTSGLWACYKFASGALETDSSGNGRTLTANGATGPTYSATEPSDITADDPPSAGGLTTVVTVLSDIQ